MTVTKMLEAAIRNGLGLNETVEDCKSFMQRFRFEGARRRDELMGKGNKNTGADHSEQMYYSTIVGGRVGTAIEVSLKLITDVECLDRFMEQFNVECEKKLAELMEKRNKIMGTNYPGPAKEPAKVLVKDSKEWKAEKWRVKEEKGCQFWLGDRFCRNECSKKRIVNDPRFPRYEMCEEHKGKQN